MSKSIDGILTSKSIENNSLNNIIVNTISVSEVENINCNTFKLKNNPVDNYVLTCDATGAGTWEENIKENIYNADGVLTGDRVISGLNTLTISTPLKYDGSTPINGYILSTDEDGNASWTQNLASVTAGTGINVNAGVVSIANTAVTPNTYGNSTNTPTITIDQQGRITSASNTAIDHNQLLNFVANKHIDHSTVNITAGTGLTGGGDLTATRTLNLANTAVTPNTYGNSTNTSSITIDQQGRITSASNTAIDHDQLLNFVANEHIDHSTVNITAGTGLTGGGDLTATRTLNLANTDVTPSTYGNSTNTPTITIDQQGRITAASNTIISFPNTLTISDGSLSFPSFNFLNDTDTGILRNPANNEIIFAGNKIPTGVFGTNTFKVNNTIECQNIVLSDTVYSPPSPLGTILTAYTFISSPGLSSNNASLHMDSVGVLNSPLVDGRSNVGLGQGGLTSYRMRITDSTKIAIFSALNEFSTSFWIRPTTPLAAAGQNARIFDTSSNPFTSYITLEIDSVTSNLFIKMIANNVSVITGTSTGSQGNNMRDTGAAVNTNAWNHIVLSTGSSGFKLYLNTILIYSNATTLSMSSLQGLNVIDWRVYNTSAIDDIVVTTNEITPTLVSGLYNDLYTLTGVPTFAQTSKIIYDNLNARNAIQLSDNTNVMTWNNSKLQVHQPLQISSGTPINGAYLSSDANGNTSWVTPNVNTTIDHSTVNITAGTGLTGGGDLTATRTLNLANTAVTPNTYGNSTNTTTITIDQQGRITSASNTAIDHDQLLNFVVNEHIDHSTVNITAGTGLTGGGDLTATRTLNLANTAVTPNTYGNSTNTSSITIDQQGRITSASNTAIDHDQLLNFVVNEHIDWTNSLDNFKTAGNLTLRSDYNDIVINNYSFATVNANVFYKFNTGAEIIDSSGNNVTLTNNGDTTFLTYYLGRRDVVRFQDTGITLPRLEGTTSLFSNIDVSISLWFNIPNVNPGGLLFELRENTSDNRIRISVNGSTGFLEFHSATASSTFLVRGSLGIDFRNNTWYNVVMIFSTTGFKLYLNGQQFAPTFIVGDSNTNCVVPSNRIRLGGDTFTSQTMYLDQVSVYNRILTLSEIQKLAGTENKILGNITLEDNILAKKLTYQDTNQSVDKFIKSDSNGLMSWSYLPDNFQFTYKFENNTLSTTLLTPIGTWTKINVGNGVVASNSNGNWNFATLNRFLYTGTNITGRKIRVTANITFRSTNNQIYGINIYKNGIAITNYTGAFATVNNNITANFSVFTIDSLTTNDYFEIFIVNQGSTNAPVVTNGYIDGFFI